MGKVIEGTGDSIKCENCGRSIVVHVHVANVEFVRAGEIGGHWSRIMGTERTIGRECCKKIGAEKMGRIR